MKKKILALIALSLFTSLGYAEQTGNCTAGTDNCEQNSLATTNTTTTTNTNTNTNTNNNTNTNTNTNSNTNVNTTTTTATATNSNTNVNTNSNTNVNTSTATSTSTNNNTNVNTNNNVNTSTSTSSSTVNSTVNQNVNNTSTSNNTNTNVNTSNNTSNNTNTNTNVNQSTSDSNVTTDNTNNNNNNTVSDNTNRNINQSNSTQKIEQEITSKAPPASAIAPSIMSYSQDLCTTGRSGAFQGQLIGFSTGRTVRDENCERLKLSKYLYDTGMKVASVSILCQDPRVFKAMIHAGTPCPYEGKVGKEAAIGWVENKEDRPDFKEYKGKFVSKCKRTRNENGRKKSKQTCVKEFNNS